MAGFNYLRFGSLTILTLVSSACLSPFDTILENLGELCSHSTYLVNTDSFHGEADDLCRYTDGSCSSIKAAINTANVCRSYGRKTIVLQDCAVYQAQSRDNASRLTRTATGSNPFSAAPPILGEVTIKGRGARISAIEAIDREPQAMFISTDTASLVIENMVIQDLGIKNFGNLTLSHVAVVDSNLDYTTNAIINYQNTLRILNNSLLANNNNWSGADLINHAGASALIDSSTFTSIVPEEISSGLYRDALTDAEKHSSILNHGNLEINNSAFEHMHFSQAVIFNPGTSGQVSVRNSTFHNLSANGEGIDPILPGEAGARIIHDRSANPLRISSSTFSGGLIWRVITKDSGDAPSEMEIIDSTIADVDLSAGISDGPDEEPNMAIEVLGPVNLTIKNTAIANLQGNNCTFSASVIRNFSTSFSTDTSCGFSQSSSNANLEELAHNGGRNKTHMPRATSPLIDRGESTASVDQRGANRTVDGNNDFIARADIGAVERGARDAPPTPVPTTYTCAR